MLPRTDRGEGPIDRVVEWRRSRFLFALRLSRDERASVDKRVDDRPLPYYALSSLVIWVRGELSPFGSLRLVLASPARRTLNPVHSHNALSQRGCVVRGIHEDASLELLSDPSWRVCAPG